MKKLLLSVLCALVLVGCSNGYANISDRSEALLTINGNTKLTKGTAYDALFPEDGVSASIEVVLNYVLDKECPVTDEDKEAAQKQIDEVNNYGEGMLDYYLMYYGFFTEENLFNSLVRYEQQSRLVAGYVETKFDDLAATYKPTKAKVLKFSDADTAKAAIDEIKAGEDFATVGTSYGSSLTGAETVYMTDSSLDANALVTITSGTSAHLYENYITGQDGSFYVVEVTNADPESFKEEAIDSLTGISNMLTQVMRYYLKENNFKIYDKDLYDAIKSQYPDFIFD